MNELPKGLDFHVFGDVIEFIFEMMAEGEEPSFDFGSAHYLHDIRDTPAMAPVFHSKRLEKILLGANPSWLDRRRFPLIEDVVPQMLKDETSMDLRYGRFHFLPGSTRDAIYLLAKDFADDGGSIALPVPNWHFWSLAQMNPKIHFVPFDARDGQELVEGFERVASQGRINSLILVNPANPLMYELSESEAKEIDQIAMNKGINIIVDEVLRGTRPVGQRDTIARWFTQPYLVEGFSKRFGDAPLGQTSYIYAQNNNRNLKIEARSNPPEHVSRVVGTFLDTALRTCTVEAVRNLSDRNKAFDMGLQEGGFIGKVCRPFDSSLVTRVELPEDSRYDGSDFANIALKNYKLIIASMDSFYPVGYPVASDLADTLRITVGRMEPEMVRKGARLIAQCYREECL